MTRPMICLCQVVVIMAIGLSGAGESWGAGEPGSGGGDASDLVARLAQARPRVLDRAGQEPAGVTCDGVWQNGDWHGTVRNESSEPVSLAECVIADLEHGLSPDTGVYGEGFTMLAQTGGTLSDPVDEGFYPDRSHYRIPEPDGLRTVYGVMTLQTGPDHHVLLGFTTCDKFSGRFSFSGQRLRISIDLEGLALAPGQSWSMERLRVVGGEERGQLLADLAEAIGRHHRPIFQEPVPTGWCSWYCFGPSVTAEQIRGNLLWARDNFPQLKYIQIDDGYQPWMGDWLSTGNSFGGDVRGVIREIAQLGFQPAIWVAPMIASPESELFREHPDWFVKDAAGQPLRSDSVGFGGWRLGPWYCLDGTHPEAQAYLEHVFRTMRQEWGCTYFKLDATYWAAIHGGVHHDPNATRVEAYRQAMAAVRRGAGDSLLLGCNHPIWPSLGLIHASRSSMDITRDWYHISKTGRENLLRGWQNGRLWWNDPDCLVLNRNGEPMSAEDESLFRFHATLIYATGGMLLTGDDMRTYGATEREKLSQLYPPAGRCMEFADTRFTVGRQESEGHTMVALFRWDDTPERLTVPIDRPSEVIDYWTNESLGQHDRPFEITLPAPRTARLLKIVPR